MGDEKVGVTVGRTGSQWEGRAHSGTRGGSTEGQPKPITLCGCLCHSKVFSLEFFKEGMSEDKGPRLFFKKMKILTPRTVWKHKGPTTEDP